MIKKILRSFAGQMFIVLAGLAIVSACSIGGATPPSVGQQALSNTHWTLKSILNEPLKGQKPTEWPTLDFAEDRMSGFSGCNRLFGSYVASQDGTLALGQLGTTRMACPGAAGELEKQVTEQLNKVSMYALSHSQLNLMDANRKVLLVYTPTKP